MVLAFSCVCVGRVARLREGAPQRRAQHARGRRHRWSTSFTRASCAHTCRRAGPWATVAEGAPEAGSAGGLVRLGHGLTGGRAASASFGPTTAAPPPSGPASAGRRPSGCRHARRRARATCASANVERAATARRPEARPPCSTGTAQATTLAAKAWRVTRAEPRWLVRTPRSRASCLAGRRMASDWGTPTPGGRVASSSRCQPSCAAGWSRGPAAALGRRHRRWR